MRTYKYRIGQKLRLKAGRTSSVGLREHDGKIVTIKALCPFTFAYEVRELSGLFHENCFKEL
jgi:hypothetical protein